MDSELFTLHTERFTIEGRTRAGHESYFRIRELGIALDIGRGPDLLIPVSNIFISHAHLDHAVGIPFYAGQRHLQRMPGGRVHVPAENLDDFRALMEVHSRLERTEYDIELIGMAPGDTVPISRTLRARAHQATHRVPARAYEIIERRHHLRKEFAGLDRHELAGLRAAGTNVHDETEVSVLFYSGDTDRGILEQSVRHDDRWSDAIFRSEVLLIECSFITDGHRWRAGKYRHIHFDDIAEFAERFENRLIVLTHFSRRYSHDEIVAEIRRRCPAVLRDRIRLAFPDAWQRV